jgi:hypothetical protein
MKTIVVNKMCFIALCIIALTGCEKRFGEGIKLKDIEVESTVRVVINETSRARAYPVPWDCTDYTFTWTSSNPAIATVDDFGRVSARAFGDCKIVVSSGGHSKEITVDVYDPPLSERLAAFGVKYLYEFEDANNLFKPTIGNRNLEPIGSGFKQVEGNNPEKKALYIPTSVRNDAGEWINHLFLNHGFAANGGGSLVNQFTIMMDIYVQAGGGDRAIFNTKFYPTSKIAWADAGAYVRNDGRFGINGGESPNNLVLRDNWYRLVICVDFNNTMKNWRNGVLYKPSAVGSTDWDGRSWPLDGIVFFTDAANRNNVNDVTIASLAIWDRCLLDSEVTSLGLLRTQ